MKNLLDTIKNIWSIKELKNKIFISLLLMCIYRFGSYIPLPGIDPKGISDITANLKGGTKGFVQILSSFTGGAFSSASILALGIMPYISASIIIQLMGLAIPFIQKMQKEGESGRRQINRITRWLTLGICLVQAPAYLTLLTTQLIPFSTSPLAYLIDINSTESKFLFWFISIIVLTTGTLFTMWLGEKITNKGIGNGISLIIMVGIIARFPKAIGEEIYTKMSVGNGGLIFLFFEFILWFLVILFSIFIIQAVRKIPIQYVRHFNQMRLDKNQFTSNSDASSMENIPLKLISAGVMPIIFAQAIMFLPLTFLGAMGSEKIKFLNFKVLQDVYGFWYNLFFAILIIFFTFFYTAIAIPVGQIADDLKRNGGHIPGVKPGKNTAKFIDLVLSRITLPGAFLLAFIAILPSLVVKLGILQEFALFFGGTSLIIIVGAVLDTSAHVNAYLLNKHYDGFVDK